jgi:uncharacterized coiled-coil DUF342 family protein
MQLQKQEQQEQQQRREKEIAEKIFRGYPLTPEEAILLTDEQAAWRISVRVWDLCIASV